MCLYCIPGKLDISNSIKPDNVDLDKYSNVIEDPFKYKIDCAEGTGYDDSLKAYYESVSVTKPTNKTTCCETCSKLNTDSKENYNSIVEDFYAEYY
jgi:hypothetical protein